MLCFGQRFILVSSFSVLICCIAGCAVAVSKPFSWLSFNAREGVSASNSDPDVVVVITNAVLIPEKRAAFDATVDSVIDSMPRQSGLVGYSVRKQIFW